jgi:hypothetical protein
MCHVIIAQFLRFYFEALRGRDWYDFLWYVDKQTEPNYQYLSNALHRNGPWKGQNIKADRTWLEKAVKEKIAGLNIEGVKRDVIRFVQPADRDRVNAWDRNTFLSSLNRFTQRKKSRKEIEKDIDWGR